MNFDQDDVRENLPLLTEVYCILLTLTSRERHGYEIMKEVNHLLNKNIPVPTLYRHIRKLRKQGLIEEVPSPNPETDDPRRRYYKLTLFGETVCRAESAQRQKIEASNIALQKEIPIVSR